MRRSVCWLLAMVVALISPGPGPVLAQTVVLPPQLAPGPFGGSPAAVSVPQLPSGVDLSSPAPDAGATTDSVGTSDASAPTDTGPAASPPDPTVGSASAVSVLDSPPPADNGLAAGSSALGPGPIPVPGPAVGPTLPGPIRPGPILPGPDISIPRVGTPVRTGITSGPTSSSSTATKWVSTADGQATTNGWLRRLLPAADFWAWLLELLPLVLQAMLAALAALLSAWTLPPGGVVWRLPPDLSHQFGAVHQAHATMVQLADAALALIVALVGLGHILGPRAGLPALPPGEVAPRLAVAVVVAHGSLAIGGWAIDLHNALLGAVTPSSLVGFDPGLWLQAGVGGLLSGVLYALLGLMLALGGWLRLALVDVLLVAAPVLAVLWVLPLTAGWAEWALGLFSNLLAGQWLQVLALWLGSQLLAAPAGDLETAAAKTFAAIAVLLVALRLPGLLPGPRGVGAMSMLLGFAVAGRAGQAVWRSGQDRFLDSYLRRKELDLEFEAVAASVPDDAPPPGGGRSAPRPRGSRSSA